MKKDNLENILENIDEKFDLVLEGHSALSKEIQRDASGIQRKT